MDSLWIVFPVLVVVLVLVAVLRKFWPFKRIIVFEHERGLKYKNGRFVQVLTPGAYWLFVHTAAISKVDIRLAHFALLGQELLSADGVPVKISIVASYEIADANLAINKVSSYSQSLQLILQIVLREVVSSSKIDELLENRSEASQKLMAAAGPRLSEFGVRLVTAELRDVMIPGELKKMFAQVLKAQKEGQASLEKARAETAALRSLANAAKMIEDNPNLLQLRMLRTMAESSGNTFVVGVPATVTPVPINGAPKNKVGNIEPTHPEE